MKMTVIEAGVASNGQYNENQWLKAMAIASKYVIAVMA